MLPPVGLPCNMVGSADVSLDTVGVAPSVGENVGFRVGLKVGLMVGVVGTSALGLLVGRRVGRCVGDLNCCRGVPRVRNINYSMSVSSSSMRCSTYAGPGVFPPQTLKTWQPATLPNSSLQHS